MKFDKNSVIGVSLLALLFIGYFYFTRVGQLEMQAKQKAVADSLAALQPDMKDTLLSPLVSDTASLVRGNPGTFNPVGQITETFTTLENKLVKVVFSNKGGRPVSV
ncbi:MAG: rane protein insertase YidC [Bacteroidota bacterium]|jgi:YidC/Oxa1 family membrane protein insertase